MPNTQKLFPQPHSLTHTLSTPPRLFYFCCATRWSSLVVDFFLFLFLLAINSSCVHTHTQHRFGGFPQRPHRVEETILLTPRLSPPPPNLLANMAASIVGVKGIDDGKPQDLFNFSPNNISTHASTRNKDLTRRRLSMAGFDHFMQFHRAEPKSSFQPGTTSIAEEEPQDAELKLTKRRQGPSKSFSGIKPANMHSLRASYQAVKANAKQKFQTATSSKRRAASHETHERPTLQRPRSLFGLRPSTASIFSKTIDEESAATSPPASTPPSNNNDNNNNNNHTAAWTQLSGAAARQSARQFGKMPIAARSRDDSAFGEHRMRSSDHRESGISITAEIENLHIGDTTWRESVPDVPRYGEST